MNEFTLREIAEKINGTIDGDETIVIKGAAPLDTAAAGDISFLANSKYRELLEKTGASAVITDKNIEIDSRVTLIRIENPYYWFLQVFLMFHPPAELLEPGIHATAVIHPEARLGRNIRIGANVVIGKNVIIGDQTRIHPGCVIMEGTEIGEDCLLYPLVSLREHTRIGKNVIIHNGTVIGSDGFGFAPHQGIFHKIPQVGRVVIEDDVEIGANCTIDRATMGETVIHKGTKLDNLVHIAHNVEVGESTVMAAQAGISGSTKIGHHVMVGGQVGTVGHIKIGNFVQIGAQSGVSKGVPDNEVVFGYPARPIMRTKRIEAVINQLPELSKKIKKLEKELAELKTQKTK